MVKRNKEEETQPRHNKGRIFVLSPSPPSLSLSQTRCGCQSQHRRPKPVPAATQSMQSLQANVTRSREQKNQGPSAAMHDVHTVPPADNHHVFGRRPPKYTRKLMPLLESRVVPKLNTPAGADSQNSRFSGFFRCVAL